MRRRNFLAGGVGLGLLAAPSISRAAGTRVLKFVPQADLAILDPLFTAYVTRHHGLMVFDTLYGLDKDLKAVPQMVDGAVQEQDNLLWRFTLRAGLKFHDGEPVRGRDCVASIRRWAQVDPVGQALMRNVDDMPVEGDRVFSIRLKQAFPLLPDVLGKLSVPMLMILPERLANQPATTRITEMVGSGPFRFKADERLPGARAVYERFEGYVPREGGVATWTAGPKIAYFDRVEWQTMPDAATATAALQRGEVDWWEYATSDLLPLLRRSPTLKIEPTSPLGSMPSLQINHLQAPTDNVAFRRVVLAVMKQSDLMTATAGDEPGMWQDGVGIYPPGTSLASRAGMEGLPNPDDTATLKRALADSGYKGERVVVMGANDLPVIGTWAEVASAALQRIGVNVDHQTMDWSTLLTRRLKRDPIDQGGWSLAPTSVDGIDELTPLTHRFIRGLGPNGAIPWLTSPTLEGIRDDYLREADPARQKILAAQLQAEAYREVPYIPIGQYTQFTTLKKDLEGRLDGATVFWNIRRTG